MKSITVEQLTGIAEGVLADKEKAAKVAGQPFSGVTERETISEISRAIGADWILVKTAPLRFTKDDINAVANSRFYKRTGQKLLMGLAIVLLGLAMLTITWPILPQPVYYVLDILAAVGFIGLYGAKQKKARAELWKAVPPMIDTDAK